MPHFVGAYEKRVQDLEQFAQDKNYDYLSVERDVSITFNVLMLLIHNWLEYMNEYGNEHHYYPFDVEVTFSHYKT